MKSISKPVFPYDNAHIYALQNFKPSLMHKNSPTSMGYTFHTYVAQCACLGKYHANTSIKQRHWMVFGNSSVFMECHPTVLHSESSSFGDMTWDSLYVATVLDIDFQQ
ncbi:hypothetical protein TNCT_111941 [Trichonephila clavata]|uniref:Uncharacterized protein n=1 Tax=Trichonephila clavata TaxID=2740835 RepID=A0A8X6M5I0_TRICU|nr:hypothetical protein TNCT_111941 [Trichonephila clavata]